MKLAILIDHRDAVAENPDISRVDLTGVHIQHVAAANDQIERTVAARRFNKRSSRHGSSALARRRLLVAAAFIAVDALKCHRDRVFPALHKAGVLFLVDNFAGDQVA